MSAPPALTPLRTTPQNPSWAWPCVTISILISLRLTSAPSRPPAAAPLPVGVPAWQAPTIIAPTASVASILVLRFMPFVLLRYPWRGPRALASRPAGRSDGSLRGRGLRRPPWTPPSTRPLSRGSPRVARGDVRGAIGRPL